MNRKMKTAPYAETINVNKGINTGQHKNSAHDRIKKYVYVA